MKSVLNRFSRLFSGSAAPAPAAASKSGNPKHAYHGLRVTRLVRETPDACSIVLEIPDHLGDVFRYRAGQFLTLEVPHEGVPLKRCYSLSSSPDWDHEHKVTVKRVEGGRISNWLNSELKEGDTLQVLPPEGRFVMTHEASQMVLFAGGSGITPCISLIKSALRTTERRIRLVYSNRNAESVIFEAELDALVQAHAERLTVVHRLDNVDGYLRVADIEKHSRGLADAEFFLCGPQAFMDVVEAGLEAAGIDASRIHVERFVSPADPRPEGALDIDLPAGAEAPEVVHVEVNGQALEIPYLPGKTVLQSAQAAEVDLPYSCEEGFCGCCMARLVEGQVHMAEDEALSPREKEDGFVLVCQSRPLTKQCRIRYPDY